MKNILRLFVSVLVIATVNLPVSFANPTDGTDTNSKMSARFIAKEVQNRLGTPNFDIDEGTTTTAYIYFSINKDGVVDVKAVQSYYPEIEKYVAETLDNTLIFVPSYLAEKAFTLPIKFEMK